MSANSRTYVAHEQIATNIKMTFAMVFSGLIAATFIWIFALYGFHGTIARSLKSLYLPLPLKDGTLLTFDVSGLFSQENIARNGIQASKGLIKIANFLIVFPDHEDYENIKARSVLLPELVVDHVFPFGSMLLNIIVSPFIPEKPITINIKGNKKSGPVRLFKEKSVTTPHDLIPLVPAGRFAESEFFAMLDSRLAGSLSSARARWSAIIPWSFLLYPIVLIFWFLILKKLSKKKTSEKFLRGSELVPYPAFCQRLDNLKLPAGFTFGDLRLPRDFETSHFLVLGTTGSGKSVFLNQIIEQIYSRNEKAIIYDVKGEFLSKHAALEDESKDLIFYPFDIRSLRWSFFNEIRHKPDFDMLATALLQPPKEGLDKYWYDAARDVFRAGLLYLYLNDRKKNRDIIDFFNQPMPGIIAAFNSLPIEERSALKHIDGDSKPAMGIMSTLQSCIPFFRYIANQDGPFSFRDFIRDKKDRRRLYLLNIRNYEPIFKPLMTFVIDIMIREVLSLSDDRDKRIFFIVDEFASLGKLSSIFDFIGMARSKGGALVLANQDLGAIEATYGRPLLKTFYNNLNNKFVLRIEDPETSKFLSEAFGEREIIKKMESRSMSPGDFGDRHTISDQDKIEKILLQSQFQDLKDFQAYVKLGKVGITNFKIPMKFYESKIPDFRIDEQAFKIGTKQPDQADLNIQSQLSAPAAEVLVPSSPDSNPEPPLYKF